MTQKDFNELAAELLRQFTKRGEIQIQRLDGFNDTKDPSTYLPLTEYQRGLEEGKIIVWKEVERITPDIIRLILENMTPEVDENV